MENALKRLLNKTSEEKEKMGIIYTSREIAGQVELWEDTYKKCLSNISSIRDFIENFKKKNNPLIILTGAGSSEFIGYCVEGLWRKNFSIWINVVPTTRLVTNPDDYFIPSFDYLLVSFARSGNSPESAGAVKITSVTAKHICYLTVTCNREGVLYQTTRNIENSFNLLLDARTNDNGLAMTSSFSNMVVAGQIIGHCLNISKYKKNFERLLKAGENVLMLSPEIAEDISKLDFTRAVFLGNGSNYGTAVESHLKLQELTSGKIMCTYDSFLGLRHGPEAVIDKKTLIVAFLSSDPYTRKYEMELMEEIKKKNLGIATLVCTSKAEKELKNLSDYTLDYDPEGQLLLPDSLTPPVYIIMGQMLGMFKSLALGVKPDFPSEKGIIHRVVEGVRIYDYSVYKKNGTLKIVAEN